MPADERPSNADAEAVAEQWRKGMRVALAVSFGFTASVALGAIIPFLGPLFGAQFLLSSSRPMPLGKTVGMAVLILVAGAFFMVLTGLFQDRPFTFLMLLGLIYFCSFLAQALGKGGPASFLVLVVAIIVPLLRVLNIELANSILSILVTGVLTGAGLTWLAHAIVPETAVETPQPQQGSAQAHPYLRALANAAILLSTVAICLTNNELGAAMVIPITVASLLGQLDIVSSGRAALGLVIVNLFGGIVASVAYAVLTVRPNLLFMFVIVLVVALVFGGRAAARSRDAKIYAGALTTFLILFGLGVSPLPGSAAESFATRILYVAAAILYAFVTAGLLWTRHEAKPSRAL
ncbi:DUF2955 domain-containing protein [Pararhizobium sp. A13]|uniref:DUF2955 domain-containing protein n=1 Tax=Pararhizobium sp. A13 TaxID=3133975 RepID=UPI0032487B43